MSTGESMLPEELFTPLDDVRAEGTSGCEDVATTCTGHETESSRLRAQQDSVVDRHQAIMSELHDGVFREEVSELIAQHREEEAGLLEELIDPLVRRRAETLPRCTRDLTWRTTTLAGSDAFVRSVSDAEALHEKHVDREQALLKRQRSLEGVVRSFDAWAKELAD